jgi:hypothetical protein
MKLYSRWQQADPEDARTALVFGFMRHASVGAALRPWLADVLERDVQELKPLLIDDFWPQMVSTFDGQQRTEPDLVFEADDGSPLLVVVEVKPGYGQHTLDQVKREIVDTINDARPERVALIMVGADLGEPPALETWRTKIAGELAARDLAAISFELRYSSWARLGRHIEKCGAGDSPWSAYAEDVLRQLRSRELLGYKGAPVFDNDEITIPLLVTAFNRTVLAARQFFLALVGQPRFSKLGLLPVGGKSFTMLRDDGSGALTALEDYFQVSTLMIAGRKADWPTGAGVYAAVWLDEDDDAELQVGAFAADSLTELAYAYSDSTEVDPGELESATLREAGDARLPELAASATKEFRYARRTWRPGDEDADIEWALAGIEAAANLWDGTGK